MPQKHKHASERSLEKIARCWCLNKKVSQKAPVRVRHQKQLFFYEHMHRDANRRCKSFQMFSVSWWLSIPTRNYLLKNSPWTAIFCMSYEITLIKNMFASFLVPCMFTHVFSSAVLTILNSNFLLASSFVSECQHLSQCSHTMQKKKLDYRVYLLGENEVLPKKMCYYFSKYCKQ